MTAKVAPPDTVYEKSNMLNALDSVSMIRWKGFIIKPLEY